jgi:hypothetical protein
MRKSGGQRGIFDHGFDFKKRPAEKAKYRKDDKERESEPAVQPHLHTGLTRHLGTIPADVGCVLNEASTSTLVPTPPQAGKGTDDANHPSFLDHAANEMSTLTLTPTPSQVRHDPANACISSKI